MTAILAQNLPLLDAPGLAQMTGALAMTLVAGHVAARQALAQKSGAFLPRRQGEMSIVAHRGSSHTAPENTLASMQLAFRHKAKGIEFDIQKSKDGEIFLLHDDTLRRTASPTCPEALLQKGLCQEEYDTMLDQDISELSYQDFIRHVDVGSWKHQLYGSQRPPLMTEVMSIVPDGCYALCEVKGGDLATARAVVDLVKEERWPSDKLRFIGFDFDVVAQLKRLLSNANLAFQVIHLQDLYTESEAAFYVDRAIEAGLDGVDFEADPNVVTREVVRHAKLNGLQVGVWVWDKLPGSDAARNVAAFEEIGIDFFTSDLPPCVRGWMAS